MSYLGEWLSVTVMYEDLRNNTSWGNEPLRSVLPIDKGLGVPVVWEDPGNNTSWGDQHLSNILSFVVELWTSYLQMLLNGRVLCSHEINNAFAFIHPNLKLQSTIITWMYFEGSLKEQLSSLRKLSSFWRRKNALSGVVQRSTTVLWLHLGLNIIRCLCFEWRIPLFDRRPVDPVFLNFLVILGRFLPY